MCNPGQNSHHFWATASPGGGGQDPIARGTKPGRIVVNRLPTCYFGGIWFVPGSSYWTN